MGRNYDIDPTGRRFVMIGNPSGADAGSIPINVVVNWIEELRSRR